jgi:inner membrane protein YidH
MSDAAMSDPAGEASDVTRRTWLAAERTWLAWWRSGVAVGAVALAVGRFLPGLTHGEGWPFRVLGLGYGVLSVVVLLAGAIRQRRGAEALRRGSFEELSSPLVGWLSAAAIALSVVSMVLVAIAF